MSAGLHFLRACAQTADAKTFRRVPRHFYFDEEAAYYDFAFSYIGNHGVFPPLEAWTQAERSLADYGTTQIPSALAERMEKRYAHNEVALRHPGLVDAMGARNMASVETLLREMLAGVTASRSAHQAVLLSEHAGTVLAKSEYARLHTGLMGASLGWPTLDAATNGLGGGELGFFVGRPGVGKSFALLCVALANHFLGKKVLFVSMEMGLDQISRRLLGMLTAINPNTIRAGDTSVHEVARLVAQVQELTQRAPVRMISGDLNADVSGIENLVDEYDPDLVLIDALYLLRAENGAYLKKWEALTDVVRATKRLALRKNIPIIGTVQFNRNQRAQGNKSMDLSDVSGSDAIPQDASLVVGMRQAPPPYAKSRWYMEVLKNREGETPELTIGYNFDLMTFEELPPDVLANDTDSNEWMV